MNRRAVLAMRSIGCDRADLQSCCGVMDLPPPVHSSTYNKINETLEKAACTVQNQSMQRAAEREYAQADRIENDEVRDIDVSSDGSWMTPRHSSKVGIVTTIGCKTGQVVDVDTRSKVCKSCQVWKCDSTLFWPLANTSRGNLNQAPSRFPISYFKKKKKKRKKEKDTYKLLVTCFCRQFHFVVRKCGKPT